VVATKVPESGISWVNQDGVSGVNVEPRDPRAIADAIQHICADEDTYRQYCQGARARFESTFTLGRMVQGAVDIYEKVL